MTKLILLFAVILLPIHHANADSGGAPAIVCPSATDPVGSAQMLDLYEGTILYGTPPVKSNDPVQTQLARITARLKETNYALGYAFEKEIENIFSHTNALPPGIGMQVSLDVGTDYAPVLPEGCHLEAVGYQESTGVITVSETVLQKMDPTDQAAFYTHEALYTMNREFWVISESEPSRKFTSLLFSANTDPISPDVYETFTWNHWFYGADMSPMPITFIPADPKTYTFRIHNPNGRYFDYIVDCVSYNAQPLQTWVSEYTHKGAVNDVEVEIPINRTDCRELAITLYNGYDPYDDLGLTNVSMDVLGDSTVIWSSATQTKDTTYFSTGIPIYIKP